MNESEIGRNYKDGEIICREGDEARSMYVIRSGKVDIIKNSSAGELKLTTLGKGDIFGEMSFFDHMPRSATARAVGETVILSIDKKGFFAKAANDPSIAFNILEGMSRRIRSLNDELARYKKDSGLIY
ncbi:MAG: cyclic nucleotide-binding domain-containing protein [Nitrospiraceae bacterium]|nr:MAG: cyclic nucleotide-binding domain-containing protein [Nitrospiraceae bacterium]